MTSLVTNLRTRYGKLAKRFPPFFDASKRISRLLGASDPIYKCLRAFAKSKDRVSFLQIGSNDGISQDPLREFIVRNPNWSGCFVEPLPHLFHKLKVNYRYINRTNLRYENLAVSDRPGEIDLFRVKSEFHYEFPPFVDQIASIRKSHILSVCPNHPGLEEKIEQIQVRTVSITEIAASFGANGIDLVHLDVEGHEAVILRNFPFDDHLPAIIIFESGHLVATEREEMDSLLLARGYKIFSAGIDSVALRKDFSSAYGEALRRQ